jgi:ribonuclease P protein component
MPWTKGSLLWIRAGRERSGAVFVIRKSLGNAVFRNRLRRRLRHICRELPRPAETSLVVFAQPAARATSFDELRTELTRLVNVLDGSTRSAS